MESRTSSKRTHLMPHRLALPVAQGHFCDHFGRADEFFLCDVEPGTSTPGRMRNVVKRLRPGQCESIPQWLNSMAVTMVLAGGIGAVARHGLDALGIRVVTGLHGDDPREVLDDFLQRRQPGGANACLPAAHVLRHCRDREGKARASAKYLPRPSGLGHA